MRRILVATVLASALLLLGAGSGTSASLPRAARAGRSKVFLAVIRFVPSQIVVPAGGTVTWANRSLLPHNVHVPNLEFNSNPTCTVGATGDCLRIGEMVQLTFPEPGTYDYHCDVHREQGMEGVVVVNP